MNNVYDPSTVLTETKACFSSTKKPVSSPAPQNLSLSASFSPSIRSMDASQCDFKGNNEEKNAAYSSVAHHFASSISHPASLSTSPLLINGVVEKTICCSKKNSDMIISMNNSNNIQYFLKEINYATLPSPQDFRFSNMVLQEKLLSRPLLQYFLPNVTRSKWLLVILLLMEHQCRHHHHHHHHRHGW